MYPRDIHLDSFNKRGPSNLDKEWVSQNVIDTLG
jgi:hypothetical protein